MLVERLAALVLDSLAEAQVVSTPSHLSVACQALPNVLMAVSGFCYHALLRRRIPLHRVRARATASASTGGLARLPHPFASHRALQRVQHALA